MQQTANPCVYPIEQPTYNYMKKILLTFAIVLLFVGNALAKPRLKEINNKYGKTIIKVEVPASDRDSVGGLSIDNVRLYNNGEMIKAKKVDAIWDETSTIIIEFKKMKKFEGCILTFTLNGEPVSIDLRTLQTPVEPQKPFPV